MERENRQPEGRSRESRKKKSIGRTIAKVIGRTFFALFTLVLIGGCTTVMVFSIFMKYVETAVMPTVEVRAEDYSMELSSFIYYQDNETGQWVEHQTIYGEKNRIWVDFDQMPEELWQAVVAIEDERFFQHQGVDWWRTGGAVVNMFIGMKDTFGGSTITQQMLKNMTMDNKPYVNRKVREIFRALEFEKNYTKEQILEMYLNSIYLGRGCYGVQTAAQFYFGKDVGDLNLAECASLISITNNPAMYGPKYDIEITLRNDDGTVKEVVTPRELNKRRQELVLDKMAEVGRDGTVEDGFPAFITEAEAEAAKAQTLQFIDDDTEAKDIVAKATGGLKVNNWFVDEVIRSVTRDLAAEMGISTEEAEIRLYSSGYKIYTTMDLEMQELAESIYRDRSNLDNLTARDGQPIQSGITILDPYTGDIKAIVGSMDEKTGNLWSNYATMKKQPGSSIKPLTAYAPALDAGVVTPATAFDDYPVRLLNGTHWPKNSPNRYRGFTQVDTGVRNSINTMALQSLQAVGTAEAFAFATEKLGLDLVAADMDESPLGMGGLTEGLSTVEMAAAYACFVNQGVYNEPRFYLKVEDAEGEIVLENESNSHVAMKETTAHLMNTMLKSAVSSGTGTQARFSGMTIAGKTGTTNDNYARYFVGYTPYYVAAVWTGYKYNAKISYSGGNPAITMWKKVMEPIHAELENKDFTAPSSGLSSVTVCADSGLKPTDACREDVRGTRAVGKTIAAGTGPSEECTLHVLVDYCSEGKCLAGAYCPETSVARKGVLNHTREVYGSVKAEDDAYLLSTMQKAAGMTVTAGVEEDVLSLERVAPQTIVDPATSAVTVIGCPVHTEPPMDPALDPNNPNYVPPVDPSDPNYVAPVDPSNPGNIQLPPSGGETGTEVPSTVPAEPTDPTNPTDPTTPVEPETPIVDPSGGTGTEEDWWDDLWNEQTG